MRVGNRTMATEGRITQSEFMDACKADVYSMRKPDEGAPLKGANSFTEGQARDEDADRIEAVLANYKPIDPVTRGAEYRKTGWATFDEKAPAYRPNQAEIDRMRATWPG